MEARRKSPALLLSLDVRYNIGLLGFGPPLVANCFVRKGDAVQAIHVGESAVFARHRWWSEKRVLAEHESYTYCVSACRFFLDASGVPIEFDGCD